MENKNWFTIKGDQNDIAVSTRVRLARNIEGIPFGARQSAADSEKVVRLCSAQLLENPVTKDVFTLKKSGSLSDAEPMPEGAVISAEPGIYLPGRFGVRIEDVLYLTADGCLDITEAPKELIVL